MLHAISGTTHLPLSIFTGNGNGTVTYGNTGLIWQKCSNGLSGTDCLTGSIAAATWTNALSFCEGLSLGGRSDWRLPNINELGSIVDVGKYNPSINTVIFPNTTPSYYWSSSVNVDGTTYAWGVGFYSGDVGTSLKAVTYYVRCVSGP